MKHYTYDQIMALEPYGIIKNADIMREVEETHSQLEKLGKKLSEQCEMHRQGMQYIKLIQQCPGNGSNVLSVFQNNKAFQTVLEACQDVYRESEKAFTKVNGLCKDLSRMHNAYHSCAELINSIGRLGNAAAPDDYIASDARYKQACESLNALLGTSLTFDTFPPTRITKILCVSLKDLAFLKNEACLEIYAKKLLEFLIRGTLGLNEDTDEKQEEVFMSMPTLSTNDVFQAVDSLGNAIIYRFIGVNLTSGTGSDYIRLRNLYNDTVTNVEYQWFKQRDITKINAGDHVIRNGRKAIVASTEHISTVQFKVLTGNTDNSTETWLWKDTILFGTFMEQQGENPITVISCSRPCVNQKDGICQEKFVNIDCDGSCMDFHENSVDDGSGNTSYAE